MKITTLIAIITISNNLARVRQLLGVFCASEAQLPKNVIHQMQHFFDERKRFVKFCSSASTHMEKIASLHSGHGKH